MDQILYPEIADMAAERIKTTITESLKGENQIKAILDAYNPTGTTAFVKFTTSKALRWQTRLDKSHVNWVVCDSDWEAEFARVAEGQPFRMSTETRKGGVWHGVRVRRPAAHGHGLQRCRS